MTKAGGIEQYPYKKQNKKDVGKKSAVNTGTVAGF
jgi:hypothetical protein